jgi:hypothetical protein
MKHIICIIATLLGIAVSTKSIAQEERTRGIIWSYLHGLEYELKAGVNIGGTAPLPLPSEIREINSYSPNLALSFGTEITKWFSEREDNKTGIVIGLRFETKGMTTNATVKNYGMEIIGDRGELVDGRWTGKVKTKVNNAYFTLPLMFAYKPTPRWTLKAGPYFSYLLTGDFSGHVSDGYIRQDDPTGEKIVFEDGKTASYDFTNDLRKFQWGAQVGGKWQALKHFSVNADLTWGINGIFKKDFKTITFKMYPIYLSAGFGYLF